LHAVDWSAKIHKLSENSITGANGVILHTIQPRNRVYCIFTKINHNLHSPLMRLAVSLPRRRPVLITVTEPWQTWRLACRKSSQHIVHSLFPAGSSFALQRYLVVCQQRRRPLSTASPLCRQLQAFSSRGVAQTRADMASLNLSINGPSIKSSYQGVINGPNPSSNSPTYAQWALFSVQAPLMNAFQDSGAKESVLKVESTGGWLLPLTSSTA
jgi:hypothetical protein